MFFLKYSNNIKLQFGKDWIKIEGPKGSLLKKKNSNSLLVTKNNKVYLLNKTKDKINLLYNLKTLIKGVTLGFVIKLHLIGTGYRIIYKDSTLHLQLGFSHPILYKLPADITFKQPKDKISIYLLGGIEYNKLTQIAAKIKNYKKPEPYKGKGIRYYNEIIIRKEGKKNNV